MINSRNIIPGVIKFLDQNILGKWASPDLNNPREGVSGTIQFLDQIILGSLIFQELLFQNQQKPRTPAVLVKEVLGLKESWNSETQDYVHSGSIVVSYVLRAYKSSREC